MSSRLTVFGGNSNPHLVNSICHYLKIPKSEALVSTFLDGETRVELLENIRGAHVFLIQPTCAPVNQSIMESLIMVDACRRASAETITLVAPYFGYARQERKNAPRTPITAKLVAELYEAAGIDRLLTMELHNPAIQGFFNVPVDHLFARPVWHEYFKAVEERERLIVVSPDAGGVERARSIAKRLGCGLAVIDKRRDRPNESAVLHIVGEVTDKDCLIIDDIVDTGGSLVHASDALVKNGAKSVSAAITHAVLSGPAIERIEASTLTQLVVTDTIPLREDAKNCKKIKQISVAPLFAEAIRRVYSHDSISSLFQ